jgi:DNA (cytosine-5)-methyltransferase 1
MIFVGVREDIGREPSHPEGWSEPVGFLAATNGASVDPAEVAYLLDCGNRFASYREWPLLRQGQSTRFGDHYRIDDTRPVHTILKSAGNTSAKSVMHSRERRRPTHPEFKRCASFPDAFRLTGEWGNGVERIGNSASSPIIIL